MISVRDRLASIQGRAQSTTSPQRQAVTGSIETVDVLDDFATHVCSTIDTSNLSGLKVVADTANGMGGLILPPVFSKLPFELEILFPELDGNFPNHPADPLQQENQEPGQQTGGKILKHQDLQLHQKDFQMIGSNMKVL